MSASVPIHAPNCVVGVIGGGQLGRMIALAARRLGVRTVIWTGGLEAPAVECADEVIDLPFDDEEALRDFCGRVTVSTVEFENIPCHTLEKVAECTGLFPSPRAICICQNREREKNFLKENGIPHTWYAVISNAADLAAAMKELNGPGVLKTADFGYDGKGQLKLEGTEDPETIWAAFDAPRAVLEAWVPFDKELSVMVARGADGVTVTYDPAENRHRHHILDVSIVPARVSPAVTLEAAAIARRVAEALDYRGILGVEFFLKADGSLLVNEIAPRPHNSGHHTLDACVTSQFEQQLRAVIGLPLGSTRLLSPVVMLNLLGDMWPEETTPPDWHPLFADGEASLHLYGKRHARGRRKMGHANILGATTESALERAEALKAEWLGL
ncbi:5-(carboxyamino)imidazole ribonucleotide synthase [Luteolibacter yonseiensis]|uniref:N5-carboxyaminoimidazole ribonucleotide synthase n=1 Tax=Luteolibacter yonseiensis TaxID=1144680 RepID=A0A934VAG0_9BACT|nr:5-(carboxyamino)imidazole ribonucleotide synthase [Luteolibacter yonseiensis]MBK1814821.1 5-(carboxyamino)imidazole ribonucleotide synthase [Luteolibacter yonseiensis]